MKPAIINIVLYQGSTFRKNFQWLTESTPTNLSNFTIRMQVKQDYFSPVVQEFSTATGGITLTDASTGKFRLEISASISSSLVFSKYIYDIEVDFPDGSTYRVIKGDINLDREVTK